MLKSSSLVCIPLVFALLCSGCASSLRPNETARLTSLHAGGQELAPVEHKKNPWVSGLLGVTAPLCNLYLAYGTGRHEQLPMAIINLAIWPLSAVWAIPGCVLDTKTVNQLSFLVENPESAE